VLLGGKKFCSLEIRSLRRHDHQFGNFLSVRKPFDDLRLSVLSSGAASSGEAEGERDNLECPRCALLLSPSTNYCPRCGEPQKDAAAGSPQQEYECEIRWWRGYAKSCFFAATSDPSPNGIDRVSPFFWSLRMASPAKDGGVAAAHKALVEQLLGEGWEPAGLGAQWYERRFTRGRGASLHRDTRHRVRAHDAAPHARTQTATPAPRPQPQEKAPARNAEPPRQPPLPDQSRQPELEQDVPVSNERTKAPAPGKGQPGAGRARAAPGRRRRKGGNRAHAPSPKGKARETGEVRRASNPQTRGAPRAGRLAHGALLLATGVVLAADVAALLALAGS
jgi:hypothetical protein